MELYAFPVDYAPFRRSPVTQTWQLYTDRLEGADLTLTRLQAARDEAQAQGHVAWQRWEAGRKQEIASAASRSQVPSPVLLTKP